MIEITRTGKRAINLRFDLDGATHLRSAFEKLSNCRATVLIESAFDRGVTVPQKRGNIQTLAVKIGVGDGIIVDEANGIAWLFEEDEVEYALERFGECIRTQEFSPAEFVQVRAGKAKELDDVYCEMIPQQ